MKKKILLIIFIVADILFLGFITYNYFTKNNETNGNKTYYIYKVNNGNNNYTYNVTDKKLDIPLYKTYSCNNCEVYFPNNLKYMIIKDKNYYVYDFINDIKDKIDIKDEYNNFNIYKTKEDKDILTLQNNENTIVYSITDKKILYSEESNNLNYSYVSLYNGIIILNNKIININTNEVIKELKDFDNAIYQIVGSINNYYILQINTDTGKMKLYDSNINQLNIEFEQLAFDKDNNIITKNNNQVIIYDETLNIKKTSTEYDKIISIYSNIFLAVEKGSLKIFDMDFKELKEIMKWNENYMIDFNLLKYESSNKLKIVVLAEDKTFSYIYDEENNSLKEE